MNNKKENYLMKPIIPLSVIAVLAALALAGCGQNTPSNSTETPSTNSSMSHENGMMGETNNMMPTNNMPNMDKSETNNMPQMNTNMPASHN